MDANISTITSGGEKWALPCPQNYKTQGADEEYSGDLNNEHLNNGTIWITNFQLSGIQMSGIQMVVRYWDHHSNTGQNLVRYSNSIRWSDNFRPFEYQTSPVFRSPLYIYMFAIDVQPFVLSQKHLASNKLYIKTWKRCCYCEFFVVHWINIQIQ